MSQNPLTPEQIEVKEIQPRIWAVGRSVGEGFQLLRCTQPGITKGLELLYRSKQKAEEARDWIQSNFNTAFPNK